MIQAVGIFSCEMAQITEFHIHLGAQRLDKSSLIIGKPHPMMDVCPGPQMLWSQWFQSAYHRTVLDSPSAKLEFCFDTRIWHIQMNVDHHFWRTVTNYVSRF